MKTLFDVAVVRNCKFEIGHLPFLCLLCMALTFKYRSHVLTTVLSTAEGPLTFCCDSDCCVVQVSDPAGKIVPKMHGPTIPRHVMPGDICPHC